MKNELEINIYHVDDWISDLDEDQPKDGNIFYARWVMMHFRLPAAMKYNFNPFMQDKKLFCNYNNIRYRCTGASRLGDVWLTTDFNQEQGYELRVDVTQCSQWSALP